MSEPSLKKPNFSVSFEPANSLLRIYWQGQVAEKEIREGYEKAFEILKQNPTKRVLIDFSKRRLAKELDPEPVFEDIFNQVLKLINSTLFLALVVPKEEYFLTSEQNRFGNYKKYDNEYVIVESFLTRPEAEAWLASVK